MKLIPLFFAFLLIFPIVRAIEYCVNNVTLVKNYTFTFCEDNKCKVYSKIEEVNCTWGCDPVTNSCSPNPFLKWGILVLIIVAILFISFLIWRGGYYR